MARRPKTTLSVEKTRITRIDDGFVFLGFRIQRRPWCDGRRTVLTMSVRARLGVGDAQDRETDGAKYGIALAGGGAAVGRSGPSGRAAHFRYGASKRTFSYPGWYAWWRLILRIRCKHPHLTWKQLRRRSCGADRITEGGNVLYAPAKTQVQRYTFRGAQISTPYNIERGRSRRNTLPPDEPR
ncbi:hypothetical protein [Streptomyces sp. NPDC003247]|uniref:hypothetical protein n=1 Tax=Streptomyces sp. NPDC003247 TaxID=3364677 RepID=UPI00367D8F03